MRKEAHPIDLLWCLATMYLFGYFYSMRSVWFYAGNASYLQAGMVMLSVPLIGIIGLGRSVMIAFSKTPLVARIVVMAGLTLPAPIFVYSFSVAQGLLGQR